MEYKNNIFTINLEPTIGAEMKKTRPCLIISPDEMNKSLKTVQIAPLTTNERNIPSRVKISATSKSNLKNDSFVALDQIKTIDKSRIGDRIGEISKVESQNVSNVLIEMFRNE